MSGFSTVGIAGSAAAINAVYAIGHKHDPFPVLLAGAMFTGVCVVAGGFDPRLGTACAALYLVSTLINRGPYFTGFVSDIAGSAPSKKK